MNTRHSGLSIRSLDSKELEHVFKTFAQRVGLHNVLSSKCPKEVVELDELVEALSLESWPDSSAKADELQSSCEPLSHPKFERLDGYSVYWNRSSEGLFLWIASQPSIPANRGSMLDMAGILKTIMDTYHVYITKDYLVAVRKRRIRRLVAMPILYACGLALMITITWWPTGSFEVKDIPILSFRLAIFTIAFGASDWMARRLGFAQGLITMLVLWLFVAYVVVLTSMKIGLVDIVQWQTDAYALALSALLGFLVAELKNPLKTLGETLAEGGWGKVYRESLATPALIVAPTFGALKIIEYIIDIMVADIQSAAIAVPVGVMVIVALMEFIRREMNRSGSG